MRATHARRLDRALSGRAEVDDVKRLVAVLRDDAEVRAAYDRGAAAMRALERRSIAQTEIDWVERRLEADGLLRGASAPTGVRAWARAWWIGTAVLAAALAVLVLRPPRTDPRDDLLVPRGHGDPRAGWFAVSMLCDAHGQGALVEASGGHCPHDGTLAFAVRVDARHRGAEHLVIFGIDARGEVQYYVPTPESPPPVITRRDVWTSLDRAVRLRVNHPVGRVRVYAALLAHPPTLEAIDAAAAVLAGTPTSPRGDETPWLDRLGPGHPLLVDCPVAQCIGAELELQVDAAPGSP